jgi:tetratricopeptide (TPR) repeat protein
VSGPALEVLYAKLSARIASWPKLPARLEAGPVILIASALLCVQAFWPRDATPSRPSAAHYYNLGLVEESLGRLDDAGQHYAKARERNPRQAAFFLAEGRVLRRLGRFEEAMRQLTHIIHMPNTPAEIHAQAHDERILAAAGETVPAPPPAAP